MLKKTKAMFFGDSFRRNSNLQFTLTLNGGLIDFADDYEYLGVKLDPRLHFDKHMSKVKRNIGEKLHIRGQNGNGAVLVFTDQCTLGGTGP